jgi:hypothetical protein
LSSASGGTAEDARVFADTWAWGGGTWAQIQDMGPRGRWNHTLAFDPASGRLTLFGGFSSDVAGPDGVAVALGDTWERAGNPLAPSQHPTVTDAWLVPPGDRLVNPGDQLKIEFTVTTVPPSGLQLLILVGAETSLEPATWSEVVGLTVIGPGKLEAGSTGGQITVVRGSEPLASGTYGVAIVEADHVFGSGEQIAWFEAGGASSADPISIASISLATDHALEGPDDTVMVEFTLTRSAPQGGLTVVTFAVPAGVTAPSSIPVGSGEQKGQFLLTRTSEPMEPGPYGFVVMVEGTEGPETTISFQVA